MRNQIVLAALIAAYCGSAETVRTATQPWVRSYVASNKVDISGKADRTNTYTMAETDAKIVELSPPTSLEPATNYTDQVATEFEDGTRTVREAEVAGNAAFADNAGSADYALAADGLIGPGVTYSWFDLFRQSTNAAEAVTERATNELDRAIRADFPSGTPEWRVVDVHSFDGDALCYVTNGMTRLFLGDEVVLSTNGWPEGAAMFVQAIKEYDAWYPAPEMRLIGYGTWPTNDFQSVWWRSGTTIYVNILVEE